MPHIEKIYKDLGENQEDVIILGVTNPQVDGNPYASDGPVEDVLKAIKDGGYTFPTVMDKTGDVFMQYGITSFPTTFMIDRDGNVYGGVTGALSENIMRDIIRQTQESGE